MVPKHNRLSFIATALLLVPALVGTVAVASSAAPDAAASVSTSSLAPTIAAAGTTGTIVLASAKKKSSKLSFTPAKVVKVAKKYKGARYRFGGTTPAGFDCSGFTKFIYAKFGVSLPHSASAQGRLGDRVSKAKAKPGDLVITGGGGHVGIWVSKNTFIDAPKPGEVVHVRKIYTPYYFVVRVDSATSNA